MKKVFAAITCVLTLALPGMLLAETGTVASSVFLRDAPNMTGHIIGGLTKGDALTFTTLTGNTKWVRVIVRGKEGFTSRKAIAGVSKTVKQEVKSSGGVVSMALAMGAIQVSNPTPAKGLEAAAVPKGPSIFEIIPEASLEEVRLHAENAKLTGRVKDLESKLIEIGPLKEEVPKLRAGVHAKDIQIARYHSMFPYIEVIESLETSGKEILLAGIGKAKMVTTGAKVIIRLDNENINVGERAMKSVIKERYQTGSGVDTRVYYVLNNQSIKGLN